MTEIIFFRPNKMPLKLKNLSPGLCKRLWGHPFAMTEYLGGGTAIKHCRPMWEDKEDCDVYDHFEGMYSPTSGRKLRAGKNSKFARQCRKTPSPAQCLEQGLVYRKASKRNRATCAKRPKRKPAKSKSPKRSPGKRKSPVKRKSPKRSPVKRKSPKHKSPKHKSPKRV